VLLLLRGAAPPHCFALRPDLCVRILSPSQASPR
jgi:hypothetical protein